MYRSDVFQAYVTDFKKAFLRDAGTCTDIAHCILLAVTKAYGDMSPRTIKGHCLYIQEQCIPYLADRFSAYFCGKMPETQAEFDRWHDETCRSFLGVLNEALQKKGLAPQAYGKAQKTVNMTFKYLYCLRPEDVQRGWFRYCHMPLDTYTLSWFYGNGNAHGPDETWSNLSAERYRAIAGTILNHDCKAEYGGLSALEAEFIIWQKEKNRAALKALRSSVRQCTKSDFLRQLDASQKRALTALCGELQNAIREVNQQDQPALGSGETNHE